MFQSRRIPAYHLVAVLTTLVIVPGMSATINPLSSDDLVAEPLVTNDDYQVVKNAHSNLGSSQCDLPNALKHWGEILQRISNRPVAIFLDYDGTLSPHVPDPEKAIISEDMISVLKVLSGHYRVSIITGRPMAAICRFLNGIDNLYYAASHGLDIAIGGKDSDSDRLVIGRDYIPYLKAAYDELKQSIGSIEGCIVENNGLSVSVHYRNVEDENHQKEIHSTVKDILSKYSSHFKKIDGEKVWELRPNMDWDKGKAVEHILKHKFEDSSTISIYLGDDTTDEDAFKVIRHLNGIAILVNKKKKQTAAEYVVADPDDVLELLKRLSNSASSFQG